MQTRLIHTVLSGMDFILTTPEKISQIVTEAVSIAIRNHSPKQDLLPDRIGINEVCELTDYKKGVIYKLTMDNKIPYSKFGGKLVFSKKEIIAWIENQTISSTSIKDQVSENLMKQAKKGRFSR